MRKDEQLEELLDELITAAGEEHIDFEEGNPGKQHTREVERAKIDIRRLFVDAELWSTCFDRPENAGWYITWWHDNPNAVSPRYYDDTAPLHACWFMPKVNGGGDSICVDVESNDPLVVNMSFDLWRALPQPPQEVTLKDIYHL